ncbi:MAG: hypothetical protein WAM78_04355, partial [Candidatus Sulfotelmatobacter sp.]
LPLHEYFSPARLCWLPAARLTPCPSQNNLYAGCRSACYGFFNLHTYDFEAAPIVVSSISSERYSSTGVLR